jgi:uncharacterized protein YcfJ
MPGANKPFDVFVQEDQLCRGWAAHSIGLAGHDAAAERMLASTVTGAVIGAVAGAALDGGRGAGAGAAVGTALGGTLGSEQGAMTAMNAQRRYDIAYQQCMYSKGNVVSSPYGTYRYPVPPPLSAPPPPPTPVPAR